VIVHEYNLPSPTVRGPISRRKYATCRRVDQVLKRPLEDVRIVPPQSDDVVTGPTQQTSNFTGSMVMVDGQRARDAPATGPRSTDGTEPVLILPERLVLLARDAVGGLDPVRTSLHPALALHPAPARSAPWSRVRSRTPGMNRVLGVDAGLAHRVPSLQQTPYRIGSGRSKHADRGNGSGAKLDAMSNALASTIPTNGVMSWPDVGPCS